MTPARLFMIAAAGFAVLTPILEMRGRTPALDLYIHDGYYVIANSQLALAAAANCGIFALLYFMCGRLLRRPLNRGLSLSSFFLIVLPLGALIVMLHSFHPNSGAGFDSRMITVMLVGVVSGTVSILIGCALFVVNFSWALVQVFQTRE